jgi:uncharacterized Zn-finger protein
MVIVVPAPYVNRGSGEVPEPYRTEMARVQAAIDTLKPPDKITYNVDGYNIIVKLTRADRTWGVSIPMEIIEDLGYNAMCFQMEKLLKAAGVAIPQITLPALPDEEGKVKCDYCGGRYDAKLDDCPHCGAPSK